MGHLGASLWSVVFHHGFFLHCSSTAKWLLFILSLIVWAPSARQGVCPSFQPSRSSTVGYCFAANSRSTSTKAHTVSVSLSSSLLHYLRSFSEASGHSPRPGIWPLVGNSSDRTLLLLSFPVRFSFAKSWKVRSSWTPRDCLQGSQSQTTTLPRRSVKVFQHWPDCASHEKLRICDRSLESTVH